MLLFGYYFRTIEITGNDPVNPVDYIFVTLQVNLTSIDIPENVLISNDNGNIVLSWSPVYGVVVYSIYSSVDPDLPKADWTLETTVSTESWEDSIEDEVKFYYIKADTERN